MRRPTTRRCGAPCSRASAAIGTWASCCSCAAGWARGSRVVGVCGASEPDRQGRGRVRAGAAGRRTWRRDSAAGDDGPYDHPHGGASMTTDAHSKVQARHLKRHAYLYIRPSSLRQVFCAHGEYAAPVRPEAARDRARLDARSDRRGRQRSRTVRRVGHRSGGRPDLGH